MNQPEAIRLPALIIIPALEPSDPFRGLVWLTSKQAALYVGSRSVAGFREWRRRWAKRGVLIPTRNNGSVAKADLDRALRVKRRVHPNSVANLAQSPRRRRETVAAVEESLG